MDRVLIVISSGTMVPYIMKAYKRAFECLGCKTMVLDLFKSKREYTKRGISAWVNKIGEIQDFNPDFAVSYGYTGMIRTNDGILFRQLSIPLILLHYDCPFFDLETDFKKEFLKYQDYYYHFIWDRDFFKDFGKTRIRNLFQIMLAADENIFSPFNNNRYSYKVSFIGSLSNSSESRRLRRKQDLPIINRFIDIVIETKLKNIDLTINEICSNLIKNPKFKALKSVLKEEIYYQNIYYAIHHEGSFKLRKKILNSIDPKLLTVFGAQKWNEKIKFLPETDYYEGLEIFRKSQINLNISSLQLEKSLNNRVFDVFASGGFLLTDFKEDIKSVFPDYKDIVYTSEDELREKIDFYLNHEKRREEIVHEMQEIILKEHTYKNRAKYVLRTMEREWKQRAKLIKNI